MVMKGAVVAGGATRIERGTVKVLARHAEALRSGVGRVPQDKPPSQQKDNTHENPRRRRFRLPRIASYSPPHPGRPQNKPPPKQKDNTHENPRRRRFRLPRIASYSPPHQGRPRSLRPRAVSG